MKKSLVFCIVFLAIGVCLNAQTIIPKFGLSLSSIKSDDNADYGIKSGLVFGVGSEFELSKSWTLQPELLLSQKGYSDNSPYSFNPSRNEKLKVRFNYIEIPLLLKYKFRIFYLNIGPSVSYGIGGVHRFISENPKEESSGNVKFGKGTLKGDVWYIDNALDYGLVFGGGLIVLKNINIDLRYELGQANIYSGNKNYKPMFNRTFQITAGYLLRPTKKS